MIRFGIIGCGNISINAHMAAFDKLKDKVKVSAVCDLDKDRAEKAAEILGAQRAFSDYREMVDYVDAVLIRLALLLKLSADIFKILHSTTPLIYYIQNIFPR